MTYTNLEKVHKLIDKHGTPHRRNSWLKVLGLLQPMPSPEIVETGTMRQWEGDGASTLILGHIAALYNGHLTSIDIDANNLGFSEECADVPVNHCLGDSVELLARYTLRNASIQLLYLDSYDFIAATPEPSQRHMFAEFAAATRLAPQYVMLDDTKLPHNGKAGLLIPFLQERGWTIIHDEYQQIWQRP